MDPGSTKLHIVARTDTGLIRQTNEDYFAVSDNNNLLVVADGMGGLNAGEVASQITAATIRAFFAGQGSKTRNSKTLLFKAIREAHQKILAHGSKHPETFGMGSTVVIACKQGNYLHIAWCGDSRAYIFSNDHLKLLTKDHSYVQSLVDAGRLTYEETFAHPQNNIITRHLGNINAAPEPGYTRHTMQENDILLLCSDGLNGMLTDHQISNIISKYQNDPEACAGQLITSANRSGGRDNITVVLAKQR